MSKDDALRAAARQALIRCTNTGLTRARESLRTRVGRVRAAVRDKERKRTKDRLLTGKGSRRKLGERVCPVRLQTGKRLLADAFVDLVVEGPLPTPLSPATDEGESRDERNTQNDAASRDGVVDNMWVFGGQLRRRIAGFVWMGHVFDRRRGRHRFSGGSHRHHRRGRHRAVNDERDGRARS